jgi:hypothetical protein
MEDTIGLAGSLGLINRGGAAFGGNVLTKASGKELEMDATQKRDEAKRLAKQAQEEEMLLKRINPTGKFDELARNNMRKAYADVIMNKKYRDPEEKYNFDLYKTKQLEATQKRAEVNDFFTKNKTLVPNDILEAFKKSDVATLEQKSKDPNTGVYRDPNFEDVYYMSPDKIIPKIDTEDEMKRAASVISEGDYDVKNQTKIVKNGITYLQSSVKPEVLRSAAERDLKNKVNYENFKTDYKAEIDKTMKEDPKLTEFTAATKVYAQELGKMGKKEDIIRPSKGVVINNTFNSTSGGGFESKNVSLYPEKSKDYPDGVLYRYNRKGAKPDVYNLNVGSKDDSVKKFTEVNYVIRLDDETGLVIGKRKRLGDIDDTPENQAYEEETKDYRNVPASIKVPLSVVYGELQIDDKTWKALKSEGKPAVKAAVKASANTGGAPKPKPASSGGAPRPKK